MSSERERAVGSLYPTVLAFHRLSPHFSFSSTNYSPKRFEKLLAWRTHAGYRFGEPDQSIVASAQPALGVTFDDGYRSFLTEAAPVLGEFGFAASVFVPTDYAGRQADWDADGVASGEQVLSWEEMRELQEAGFRFYSHGLKHGHPVQFLRFFCQTGHRLPNLR